MYGIGPPPFIARHARTDGDNPYSIFCRFCLSADCCCSSCSCRFSRVRCSLQILSRQRSSLFNGHKTANSISAGRQNSVGHQGKIQRMKHRLGVCVGIRLDWKTCHGAHAPLGKHVRSEGNTSKYLARGPYRRLHRQHAQVLSIFSHDTVNSNPAARHTKNDNATWRSLAVALALRSFSCPHSNTCVYQRNPHIAHKTHVDFCPSTSGEKSEDARLSSCQNDVESTLN